VNAQITRPVSVEGFVHFGRALLFVAFLCMGYELSRPGPAAGGEQKLLPDTVPQEQGWPDIPQWQRAASARAVARYAAAQERKWRRWNEAMYQPEGNPVPQQKRRGQSDTDGDGEDALQDRRG